MFPEPSGKQRIGGYLEGSRKYRRQCNPPPKEGFPRAGFPPYRSSLWQMLLFANVFLIPASGLQKGDLGLAALYRDLAFIDSQVQSRIGRRKRILQHDGSRAGSCRGGQRERQAEQGRCCEHRAHRELFPFCAIGTGQSLRVGRGAADSFTAATIHGSNQGCSRDDEALFRGTSFLKSAGRPGGGRHQATSRYLETPRLSINSWPSSQGSKRGEPRTLAGCTFNATLSPARIQNQNSKWKSGLKLS